MSTPNVSPVVAEAQEVKDSCLGKAGKMPPSLEKRGRPSPRWIMTTRKPVNPRRFVAVRKLKELIRDVTDFLEQSFRVFHGPRMQRAIGLEEDMFMLLCFSDLLGIPNPVSYYSLELLAVFHPKDLEAWIERMGRRKSLIDTCWCC